MEDERFGNIVLMGRDVMKATADEIIRICQERNLRVLYEPIHGESPLNGTDLKTLDQAAPALSVKTGWLKKFLSKQNMITHVEALGIHVPSHPSFGTVLVREHPDRHTIKTLYSASQLEKISELIALSPPDPYLEPKLSPQKPIEQMTQLEMDRFALSVPQYVFVVDTESTGMRANLDRLVSVGIALYDIQNNKVIDQAEWFVNPKLSKSQLNSYRKSGYRFTNIPLPDMPEYKESMNPPAFMGTFKVAKMMASFIQKHEHKSKTLVAHDIRHDINKLNDLLSKTHFSNFHEMNFNLYCTFRLAKTIQYLEQSDQGLSLNALCERFGISLESRHDQGHGALLDARLTAEVLHRAYQDNILTLRETRDAGLESSPLKPNTHSQLNF